MQVNLLTVCFAALFLFGLTGSALGAGHCANLKIIKDQLLKRYGEQQSHVGSRRPMTAPGPNDYYVLFTNKETGDFSLVLVYGRGSRQGFREGWACVILSGYDWSYQPNEPIIPGVDG